MENMRRDTRSFTLSKKFVGIIVFLPLVYFALLFPVMTLFGFKPLTSYYNFQVLGMGTIWTVVILNIMFTFFSALFFNMFFPKKITVYVQSSWIWILMTVLYVYANMIGNWGLDRSAIKGNSSLIKVIISATAYAYLGALFLCEKDKLKLFVVASAIILTIALTFERESILYLAFPIILRLGMYKWSFPFQILFAILGIVFLGGYKFILSKVYASGQFEFSMIMTPEFWTFVSHSLLTDNLHKGAMELFYFHGDAPDYNILTYLSPLQLRRILDPFADTNGGFATMYYTNGFTGTGYSVLLESWQNFWILGPIATPFLIFWILRYAVKTGSAMIFIMAMIFLLKLQRSELWPTVIGIALGPILLYASWAIWGNITGRTRHKKSMRGQP